MPQPFRSAVVTDEGIKLVTKSLAGEAKIEFTKISIGDGIYGQEEMTVPSLQERKELKSCRNAYGLSNIEIFSENSVKVTALITNQNPVTEEALIESGYFINEIGLYAKEKDGAEETEILYSIAITDGEKGDFIPAYNGDNPAKIIQDFYATVGNVEEVVIKDTPDAVALEKDFIKVKDELPSFMKKTGDSKENFVTFTSEDEANPSSWSDVAVLESGEKHNSIFNKISTMFRNIRWIYKKLGTTDISAIGNGTVTGALGQISSKLNPAGIGLGNVDNTHDSEKNVATADQVNGTYTNGGGQQPPAYIPSGKTRFNMWNAFKGLTNPAGGYMDCILMDNYNGNDVPWVTGIGVTKSSGNPRVFVANGEKGGTGNWANQVEVITSGNISSQNVNYANSAGNSDSVDGLHFHWSGQSGQPTWLWGGNDSSNAYVYNPSNFSVNYATSAGSATNATKATQDGSGNNIVSTYLKKSEAGVYYSNSQGSISLTNGAWNNSLAGLTLPAGVYSCTFQFNFAGGGSTGLRGIRFVNTPVGGINYCPSIGSGHVMTTHADFSLSKTTAIYGGAIQKSGATMTGCDCVISAIRIK